MGIGLSMIIATELFLETIPGGRARVEGLSVNIFAEVAQKAIRGHFFSRLVFSLKSQCRIRSKNVPISNIRVSR